MSPERDKNRPQSDAPEGLLPSGVTAIFAQEEIPGEENTAAASSPASLPSCPPVSPEEILSRAVASILETTPLVNQTPLMSPGSPQKIVEEAHSPEHISLPAEKPYSPTTDEKVDSLPETISPIPVVEHTTSCVHLGTSPTFRSRSFSWTSRSERPSPSPQQQVGTVQPTVSQPSVDIASPKIFLHDFRPGQMLSPHIPTNVAPAHIFHNLLSSIFLNNTPCSQRSLVQAMAESLEDRRNEVLHGIQLPVDPGLQPSDPLHMALYVYVAVLFEEFEDYFQTKAKTESDMRVQLQQKFVDLQAVEEQLSSLREVNSLLAKSNAPAEREEKFLLQQENRKTASALQTAKQDFNEVKAHMENLQKQLEVAELQKDSAAKEAQSKLDLHQVASAELSQLRVKIISMTDKAAAMEEADKLKAELKENASEKAKLVEERDIALAKEKALSSDNNQLKKHNNKISKLIENLEKENEKLKTVKMELSVQVKDLSQERDALHPTVQDAKIQARLQQEEKAAWESEKKSFLQDKKAQEEKISLLKSSLETLQKNKKMATDSSKEVQKLKEALAALNTEKSNFLKQIKADGVNFFAHQDLHRKKAEDYETSLGTLKNDVAEMQEKLKIEIALKRSLEEEKNTLHDEILDLREALLEKTKEKGEKQKPLQFDKLKERFQQLSDVVKELTESSPTTESTSASEMEYESEEDHEQNDIISGKLSPSPMTTAPAASSAPQLPPASPMPQKNSQNLTDKPVGSDSQNTSHNQQKKDSDVKTRKPSVSQSSHDDSLQLNVTPEEQFPEEMPTKKRASSPSLRSSSPTNKRQHRSVDRNNRSVDRNNRSVDRNSRSVERNYNIPRRQRGNPRHHELDRMSEDYHNRAYELIKDYKTASVEALSSDTNLIQYLRGQDADWKKKERVQCLLQAYATCSTLQDISDLNNGRQPESRYGFQPIPDLSKDSAEWRFIEHAEKNKFVNFASIMALYRLFCSKLYCFFHYGKHAGQPKKRNTITLLHTADRDHNDEKRSSWEKKIDLLLTLIVARVVFYTQDDVSPFDCNPDNLLHLTEDFMTRAYVDQMISARSYKDPYLLPRNDMINLYVNTNGAKAKAVFNYRIARYEPLYIPQDEEVVQRPPRQNAATRFSWMDQ